MHWLDSYAFPDSGWEDLRGDKKRGKRLAVEMFVELPWAHELRSSYKQVVAFGDAGDLVVRTRGDGAAVVEMTWRGKSARADGGPGFVDVASPEQLDAELARRPRQHWVDSMRFPERGWDDLREDADRARGLEEELRRELGRFDPRNLLVLGVVASAWPSDDIVVKTRRGAALVHLTWRGRKERPGWPAWGDVNEAELAEVLLEVASRYDEDWDDD